jgi:hypothetical protein
MKVAGSIALVTGANRGLGASNVVAASTGSRMAADTGSHRKEHRSLSPSAPPASLHERSPPQNHSTAKALVRGRIFIELWSGASIPTCHENQPRSNSAFYFINIGLSP